MARMIAAATEHYQVALPQPAPLTDEELSQLTMPVYVAIASDHLPRRRRTAARRAEQLPGPQLCRRGRTPPTPRRCRPRGAVKPVLLDFFARRTAVPPWSAQDRRATAGHRRSGSPPHSASPADSQRHFGEVRSHLTGAISRARREIAAARAVSVLRASNLHHQQSRKRRAGESDHHVRATAELSSIRTGVMEPSRTLISATVRENRVPLRSPAST